MNKFNFLFLIFGFFFIQNNLSAQICGQEIVSHIVNNNPHYKKAVDRAFEKAKAIGNNDVLRFSENYEIPVVIHIVHKFTEENISDQAIYDQIEVLNEDYSRTNADANELRSIFTDVAGTPNISFKLHEIKRVHTNETFSVDFTTFSLPDNVKETIKGGSSAIDPDHYLNIWVCKIQPLIFLGSFQGQILGYAYPPTDLSGWPDGSDAPKKGFEGVVIDYRAIGSNVGKTVEIEGAGSAYIQGRTATHEIGHYLGLRHIWGDGGGFTEINGCSVDDNIDDTPNTAADNGGLCNKNVNSCNTGAGDMPDMVENFMDYSVENCQNTFTKGQVSLMRGVLESQRKSLVGVRDQIVEHSKLIDIFPNPSSNFVHIQSRISNAYQLDIEVFNTCGQLVLKEQILNNSKINIKELKPGIYYIKVFDKNEIGLKKMVIQK